MYFSENELLNETWKDVLDYEGLYKISNLGRLKKLSFSYYSPFSGNITHPDKILLGTPNHSGYTQVVIFKDGKARFVLAHRLVAEAFLLNTERKPQVNHRNLIKTDNRVSNLEWSTPQENITHAHINGRFKRKRGAECPTSKLSDADAKYIRKNALIYNQSELAAAFGVCQSTISKIINNIGYPENKLTEKGIVVS